MEQTSKLQLTESGKGNSPNCTFTFIGQIQQDIEMSLFKKIIDREIPADIVYEDEFCLAFRDINPQAPIHVLLIPKQELTSLKQVGPEDHSLLGHLLLKAAEVASGQGLAENGFRVVINTGNDGGQTVDHLHLHILGGRYMDWPPG
jgi:histidine triad (HIT) family protein